MKHSNYVVRSAVGEFFSTDDSSDHWWIGRWSFSDAAILTHDEARTVVEHYPSLKAEVVQVS